jgi:hypothetical protein
MSATVDPQEGMFDRVVEDGDLIAALEKREKLNASRKATAAKYKEQHDVVKGMLDGFQLGDEEIVRVGRFRIKMSRTEGRSVSFDTSPSRRMTISLLDDE